MNIRQTFKHVFTGLLLAVCHIIGCSEENEINQPAGHVPTAKGSHNKNLTAPYRPLASNRLGPFTTDRFFDFMFRDQDLRWEEMEKRKEIEQEYEGMVDDPGKRLEKEREIMELALEMGKKRNALFAEFGITPDKFAAATDSPEAKKERDVYLRFNHEVKEKLMEYQQRQKEIQTFYQKKE